MAACVICGDVTPLPKKRGQTPKYCSDSCRLVGRGEARKQLTKTNPELVRERNRIKISKWRAKHDQAFKESRRKHYTSHKSRILERRHLRRIPERERELAKKRYERNKEHIRAREARRRERDDVREKARKATEQWRLDNPERSKENSYRSSAGWRARLLGSFVEHTQRAVVYDRDGGICGICHQPVERDSTWEIDHVIPLSRGGVHSYANVQLSHSRCNRRKWAHVPKGQIRSG